MNVRSPLNTPELQQIKRDVMLAKATTDLLRMHAAFMEKVDHVENLATEVRFHAGRISRLPKGDKGDRGDLGLRGLAGKDAVAKDGKDGRDGKDGKTPDVMTIASQVLKMIRAPQDGKDAIFDKDTIVAEVLTAIKDKKSLTKAHIYGLEEEMVSVRSLAGKQYGKDTWARGGGDTVSAGTNVTITRNANGDKVINSSGSGGSGYQQPTVGVVNGVNAVFTWTSAPSVIIVDQGRPMQKVSSDGTVNWTGTTVTTLAVAPNFDIFASA